MILILVLALMLLGAAAYVTSERAMAPARRRREMLDQARTYGAVALAESPPTDRFTDRVLGPLTLVLARAALRLQPKTSLDDVRVRLAAAGLLRRVSPTGFLALKMALTAAGPLVGIAIGNLIDSPPRGVALALVLPVAGWKVPEFVLSKLASRRSEQIASELARAVDLLAVSVEAGLGFDAAVAKLLERLRGPLADEFQLLATELRVGSSRKHALRALGERVPVPEMVRFTQTLIQAEQLGISISRILRTQADEMRRRRQAAAEERAMKAPVKMLFPTVLFIFPVMFVVVLGPSMLSLQGVFS